MASRTVYHLTTAGEWEAARVSGTYRPPSLGDQGFIHTSNADQLDRTARRFYADVADLVVLVIEVDRLGDGTSLVDEPGDVGSDELFPHLYGPLPASAVVDVRPYRVGDLA